MQERKFLKSLALSPVLVAGTNLDFSKIKGKASIIDLDRCDGCTDFDMPKRVSACKEKNAARFPKSVEEIPNYFPRKINEDYLQKQNDTSRLSPYNWTFVETVEVDSKKIFIPRRCMHCDNPTCQEVCPFGAISKDKNNVVNIDEHFCFGGAKCHDVCPWGIPRRQAGVGIYLKIAPKLASGGAMFKCDTYADLLAEDKKPACETQYPKNAITFDDKTKKQGKFIYGDTQNGGTSTFYISSVDFTKIDEVIAKKYENTGQVGRPHMKVKVDNFINEDSTLIKGVLTAPLVGVVAEAIAVTKARRIKKKKL